MAARFWQSLPRQSELSCAFYSIIRHTSNSARTIRTDRRPSPAPPSRAPLAPLPQVRALATIVTTVVLSRSAAITSLRSGARRRVSNRVRSGRRWNLTAGSASRNSFATETSGRAGDSGLQKMSGRLRVGCWLLEYRSDSAEPTGRRPRRVRRKTKGNNKR